MAQSPGTAAIQCLAAAVLKASAIDVEYLDGYLQQIYRMSGNGDSFCLVKYSSPAGTKLLSIEEDRLASEASVLSLLGRRVDIAAPKLLEYQATTSATLGGYVISGPFCGSIMGFVNRGFSESDRIDIDRSLGQYLKRLASVTNTSFGVFRKPVWQTWPLCFAALMESLFSDAERAQIELPSVELRALVHKHWPSLDSIKEARLVLLEACSVDGLVVDEQTKDVTSVIDYSTALWGDPFISDAFHRPSQSFLEGFGEDSGGSNDKRIRRILYMSFHATLAILRQRYRPRPGNLEVEARRALATAMKYLDQIPV